MAKLIGRVHRIAYIKSSRQAHRNLNELKYSYIYDTLQQFRF